MTRTAGQKTSRKSSACLQICKQIAPTHELSLKEVPSGNYNITNNCPPKLSPFGAPSRKRVILFVPANDTNAASIVEFDILQRLKNNVTVIADDNTPKL